MENCTNGFCGFPPLPKNEPQPVKKIALGVEVDAYPYDPLRSDMGCDKSDHILMLLDSGTYWVPIAVCLKL